MTQTNGIGNQLQLNPLIDRAERNTTAKQEGTLESATVSITRTDGTSLSRLGNLLATAASSANDVRTDKVAALKSAIDSGSYSVPASDVADKLINTMLG
jgi:flagellar biosynthesis anti-sigma factor FlgM